MRSQLYGASLVVLGAIGWGTLGVASTQLAQYALSNISITGLRIIGTFICLLFLSPWFYSTLKSLRVKHVPKLIAQSLLGMLGMTFCYFNAVQSVGPAVAVALLYTAPVWSVILSYCILKESVTLQSIMMTSLAVLGVACMIIGHGRLNLHGILWGLGSGVCYAAYGVLGKDIVAYYQPKFLLFSSMGISAVALLPFLNFMELQQFVFQINLNALIPLVFLIVIGTLLPFALYTSGLKYLRATQASVYTIFEPLTAVILAAFFTNNPLSYLQMTGVALIMSTSIFNAVLSYQLNQKVSKYAVH